MDNTGPRHHVDPLLIAGGGIGGLTAALSLAQAGFHIHLYEQADVLSEIGAGLQLSPNASRILRDMGLLDAMGAKAFAPDALQIYSGPRGKVLATMPLGPVAEKRWGAPYLAARRSDLQQVLLEACKAHANIALNFGCSVTGYETGKSVTLRYRRNGLDKSRTGCALIGADGLHSKIRAQLLNDGAPRQAGYVAYRALFPASALPGVLKNGATSLWLAPHLHVVHYPLGKETINLVATVRETMADTGWGEAAKPAALFKAVSSCSSLLQDVLRAPQHWTRWPLFDRAPDSCSWPHGPVTLLGDAAHPMLPFLAQGAAQAIEDAHVLTQCLTEQPQYASDAFETYRSQRAGRAAKIQRAAANNGRVFHMRGLPAAARDTVLKIMSGPRMMGLYDWLYKT